MATATGGEEKPPVRATDFSPDLGGVDIAENPPDEERADREPQGPPPIPSHGFSSRWGEPSGRPLLRAQVPRGSDGRISATASVIPLVRARATME